MNFPTSISEIEKRIKDIQPELYGKTRNHADGAVTYLSPYISRGVISTKQVYDYLKTLDLPWYKIEKLVQELAWRDYWQQVWIAKEDEILKAIKHQQVPISNYGIPTAVLEARTGIEVVDKAINELYVTGYMHNHMRMYIASICCNVSQCHWLEPAKWLYSNLLDGDVASNHLSWQWVAGANANKKYYANQENINNFFKSDQKDTFLDVSYEAFPTLEIPDVLKETKEFKQIELDFSNVTKNSIENEKSLIYNYYNIDPYWHQGENVQRIYLIEPSLLKKFNVSQQSFDFAIQLCENIKGMKFFIGEFDELSEKVYSHDLIFKEHPTNLHFFQKEKKDGK